MKKTVILLGFLLGMNVSVLASTTDGVKALGDNPTEVQKKAVRDGAKNFCEDQIDSEKITEDGREECVMDYFAQHNLEEEPSCD